MKVLKANLIKEEKRFSLVTSSFLPPWVVIPLNGGKTLVKVGDKVEEGAVIEVDGKSVVHSSIPGVVEEFLTCQLPNGKLSPALKIRLEGSFKYLGKKRQLYDYADLSAAEIRARLKAGGVVDTFDDEVDLASILEEIEGRGEGFTLLRLFDSDPSNTLESFLAFNYTKDVAIGLDIILRSFTAKAAIIFAGKEQLEVAKSIAKELSILAVIIQVDTDIYPAGLKENLLRQIAKSCDEAIKGVTLKNSLFLDTLTCVRAFEVVRCGRPLVEAMVEVRSRGTRAQGLFRVRVGHPLGDLVRQCGYYNNATSIVVNGMMTGFNIPTLDASVTLGSKSIRLLGKRDRANFSPSQCIRCNKCKAICPEGLFPDVLYKHWTGEHVQGDVVIKSSLLCSGCSLCNSICPSRLPLSEAIRLLKGRAQGL